MNDRIVLSVYTYVVNQQMLIGKICFNILIVVYMFRPFM
jgi:hypothetical protein